MQEHPIMAGFLQVGRNARIFAHPGHLSLSLSFSLSLSLSQQKNNTLKPKWLSCIINCSKWN
jgi:hypothetical protein